MKKLLSMLGAITLIGTTSINIIACGEREKPQPLPPQPIPISKNKFTELSKLDKTIWSSVSYNNIIYVGTDNGVYQNSDENKDKFLQINGITGRITSLTADKDGNIYASEHYGKIYQKEKSENNFKLLKDFNWNNIWSIATDKDGNIYAGSYDKIYKNSKNNKDWQEIKINDSEYIRSFTFDNIGTIYASNENGNVYKSTDGVTFKPMFGTEGLIFALSFDSKNNIIYAGSKIDVGKGILYKSTDGLNFQKVREIKGEIHSLTVNNDGMLFIGTKLSKSVGTIYSYSNSEEIKEVKGTQGEVFTLTTSNDNNVYAGTWRKDSTGSLYILNKS